MSIIIVLFDFIYKLFHLIGPVHSHMTAWCPRLIYIYCKLFTHLVEWENQSEISFSFSLILFLVKVRFHLIRQLYCRFFCFTYFTPVVNLNWRSLYFWLWPFWVQVIYHSRLSDSPCLGLIFDNFLAGAYQFFRTETHNRSDSALEGARFFILTSSLFKKWVFIRAWS